MKTEVVVVVVVFQYERIGYKEYKAHRTLLTPPIGREQQSGRPQI